MPTIGELRCLPDVEPWNDAVPNAYTVLSWPLDAAPAGCAPVTAPSTIARFAASDATSSVTAIRRRAMGRPATRRREVRCARNAGLLRRQRAGGYQHPSAHPRRRVRRRAFERFGGPRNDR